MKKAFTLAEVLITLGIIGIVAAMTLPTVIANIQDKQFKSAFKKQYSTIAQAMQRAYIAEGQTYENVNWMQMPKYFCRMQKELKTLNSGIACPKDIDSMKFTDGTGTYGNTNEWPRTGQTYWHKDDKWQDKKGVEYKSNPSYSALSMQLTDGTLIFYTCGNQILIDVNGYQKPNIVGRDIFYFILNPKRFSPEFFNRSHNNAVPNSCNKTTVTLTKDNYEEDCKNGTGWGCSPLYILD